MAFRYELPAHAQDRIATVTDETSSFRLMGDPTVYAQVLENFLTSHEHNVKTLPYRDLPAGALLDTPLTFSFASMTLR